MDFEAIDFALGRLGLPPQPLRTEWSPSERDALLEDALWFPDHTNAISTWQFMSASFVFR